MTTKPVLFDFPTYTNPFLNIGYITWLYITSTTWLYVYVVENNKLSCTNDCIYPRNEV